jgi:YidC/Oxa1 family membrane protein insertase
LSLISHALGDLLQLIYNFIGDYGWSIIVFSIIAKTLLLPLNIKQTQSMKKMNELNPKMKEIQEKYKNDKEKMNAKLLELYKEHNYNPASGCLPILIQLPIIFALFSVIQNPTTYVFTSEQFANIAKSFLWLPDLSKADPIYILPVLSALTTYLQTKMISPANTKDPTTKTMNNVMPIMIGVMSLQFPSGVVLYWVVSNIYTIIQQYFMIKPQVAAKEVK